MLQHFFIDILLSETEMSSKIEALCFWQVSEMKLKYLNRTYQKVSSKMYDYNCDVKLVVGTETFKAHRDVLVNASDYFSAMFTHDMRERQDEVIRLQEVSPCGFAAMIEYVSSVDCFDN